MRFQGNLNLFYFYLTPPPYSLQKGAGWGIKKVEWGTVDNYGITLVFCGKVKQSETKHIVFFLNYIQFSL